MCKRRVERDIPQNRENKNVNVGLLNMSSEEFGDGITTEKVIQYVIVIICIAMVLKWIRKCWTRRQQRMNTAGQQVMAMNQIQPVQQHQPPALPAPAPALALPAPAPALALPAPAPAPQHVPIPIIVHHNQYKPAAILNTGESLERVDGIDRMEKYRT